jgi:hypothetical protein
MRQTNLIISKGRRIGRIGLSRWETDYRKRNFVDKILFDYQKRVLRLNRIFKLYNILQKIKDRKNEQNEGCNK